MTKRCSKRAVLGRTYSTHGKLERGEMKRRILPGSEKKHQSLSRRKTALANRFVK